MHVQWYCPFLRVCLLCSPTSQILHQNSIHKDHFELAASYYLLVKISQAVVFFFFFFCFTDFSDQSWIAAPHCDEIEPEDSQHLAATLEFTERHKNKRYACTDTNTHTHVHTLAVMVDSKWIFKWKLSQWWPLERMCPKIESKESLCRPSTFTTLPFILLHTKL